MRDFGRKIFFYVVRTVLPYFFSAWAFLTVVLFVQQASRYSEIFFSPNIPSFLVWQMAFALLPSVIAFTCPMAVLIGVITGLAKMRVDEELTAVRSAGISNFQIFLPIVFIGLVFSIFAFFVNWKGVPFTARVVRQIALQTALEKIKSPVEPGVFSTEVPSITIYVGSINNDTWENVIIFTRNGDTLRLITSEKGKLIFPNTTSTKRPTTENKNAEDPESNESKTTDNLLRDNEAEITLTNSNVITIPLSLDSSSKIAMEKINEVNLKVKTKKQEILERLKKEYESLEELGLEELKEISEKADPKQSKEAEILLNRRLLLSISPLLFALIGGVLETRNKSKGKGTSLMIAFLMLTTFYLTGLLGEQLARTDQLRPAIGTLLPIISLLTLTLAAATWNSLLPSLTSLPIFKRSKNTPKLLINTINKDITISCLKFFLLTTTFLITIYLIFTAFELWKFAGAMDDGFKLLIEYLVNLIPLAYLQIAPSCLMIAILVTLTLKSRQNEIIAWMNAGQSIYRITAPCFLIAMTVGLVNFVVQETIAPETNKKQDILRSKIRSKNAFAIGKERIWIADKNKIYSFSPIKQDNFYIFELENQTLKSAVIAENAFLSEKKIILEGKAKKILLENTSAQTRELTDNERMITETPDVLEETYSKPTHLSIREVRDKITQSKSQTEQNLYKIAFEKKIATLVTPLIACILSIPFAFSPKGKRKTIHVGYAITIWLLFLWLSNVLEQMGLNSQLSPKMAVWSPIVIFTTLGIALFSKTRT
jgi:LPS export ABC transporter permease LptG